MAIYINLLPWRQARKERAKKQFIYQGLSVGLMVGMLLLAMHIALASKIQAQTAINTQLSMEVKQLDEVLASLGDVQKQTENVNAKMQVIDFLQSGRTLFIKTLDLIPRCLPQGIILTNITKTAEQITLEGKAEHPKLISDFMRQLEVTAWFYPPQLVWVQNDSFQLSIKEKTP